MDNSNPIIGIPQAQGSAAPSMGDYAKAFGVVALGVTVGVVLGNKLSKMGDAARQEKLEAAAQGIKA